MTQPSPVVTEAIGGLSPTAVCSCIIGGYKLRIRFAPDATIESIHEHLPPCDTLGLILPNADSPLAPGVFQIELKPV